MRLAAAIVGCVALAAALSGCGTSSDRSQVRQVSSAFNRALGSGNGRAACAQLSQDTVQELVQQEGKPCPQAIVSLGVKPSPIAAVTVFVTNGKVDLADGESLFLSRNSDGWQLSAIGCKAQGGKPADEPYQCQVQS